MIPELSALVEKVEHSAIDYVGWHTSDLTVDEALALVSYIRKQEQQIEVLKQQVRDWKEEARPGPNHDLTQGFER